MKHGKIMKMVLSICVFIYFVFSCKLNLSNIMFALLITAMFYLVASLAGFLLSATGNYLIAGVLFLLSVYLIVTKLEELTNGNVLLENCIIIVACGVSGYLLYRDIRCLRGTCRY